MVSSSSAHMDWDDGQAYTFDSPSIPSHLGLYPDSQAGPSSSVQEVTPCLDICDDDPDHILNRSIKASNANVLGKRKAARELFPQEITKESKEISHNIKGDIVLPSTYAVLPKLLISQITKTNQRFAFEGKVLTVYGTYETAKDVKKYLRCDLVDGTGFGTITLVISATFIEKFKALIDINSFLRIEGAEVTSRTPYDGGSHDLSLAVDATTIILKGEPFEVSIFFIPEITIQKFLSKALTVAYPKATLAFIIVQVDKVEKNSGATFEQLTIADGPLPEDRATLTFVNKRKTLYHQLVDEFNKGKIVPYVARNIGIWRGKSNTLSILDMTSLTHLQNEKLKAKLFDAFNKQIKDLGFGKEVYGTLELTNFNGTLVVKKCSICKTTSITSLLEGAFCYSCAKEVEIIESLHLEASITLTTGTSIEISISGDIVDTLLQFKDGALQEYYEDIGKFRINLSETAIVGTFFVNKQGQLIGFNPSGAVIH